MSEKIKVKMTKADYEKLVKLIDNHEKNKQKSRNNYKKIKMQMHQDDPNYKLKQVAVQEKPVLTVNNN